MNWFGESWGARVNQFTPHAPTPIGQRCEGCNMAIDGLARGFLVPHVGEALVRLGAWHRDCFIRALNTTVREVREIDTAGAPAFSLPMSEAPTRPEGRKP